MDKNAPEVKHVVEHLEKDGRKVQVIGHLKDGKVEIDAESLKEMQAKFPNAKMVFVAVNAPFDPVAREEHL